MLRENGIHLLPHLLADMLWNGTHHVSVQLTPEYLLITRKFTAKPNGQRMNFHRELLQSLAMEQGFQSALGITPTPKEPLRYERLLLHTREIAKPCADLRIPRPRSLTHPMIGFVPGHEGMIQPQLFISDAISNKSSQSLGLAGSRAARPAEPFGRGGAHLKGKKESMREKPLALSEAEG